MAQSTKRGNKWVMEEYLPNELLVEYKEMFNTFDKNSTGLIKIRDVVNIFNMVGQSTSPSAIQNLLIDIVGSDCRKASSEFVDFKEFIAIISVSLTTCIPEDEMHLVFRQFDRDGDGYISPQELKDLLSRLGDEITEEDLEEMIREADQDGDGKVSYNEFIRVMTNSVETSSSQSSSKEKENQLCTFGADERNGNDEHRSPRTSISSDGSESDLSIDEESNLSDSIIKISKNKGVKQRLSKTKASWLLNVTARRKSTLSVKSCPPESLSVESESSLKSRINKQGSSVRRFSATFFWKSAFKRKRK